MATLLDVARNDPSTDVRGDAIFWLSQTRCDRRDPGARSDSLRRARDEEIRKKAIFALVAAARRTRASRRCRRAARRREDVGRAFAARRSSGSARRASPISSTSGRCSARHAAPRSASRDRSGGREQSSTGGQQLAARHRPRQDRSTSRPARTRSSGGRSVAPSTSISSQRSTIRRGATTEIQSQVLFVLLAAARAGGRRQADGDRQERPATSRCASRRCSGSDRRTIRASSSSFAT